MPNKVKGMRIPPDGLKAIKAIREDSMVGDGQAVAILGRFYLRWKWVAMFFRVGIERDGTRLVYLRDPATNECLDVLDDGQCEEFLLYILDELGKPPWEAFDGLGSYLESYWGIDCPYLEELES